jgi:hypothetical protein
MANSFEEMLEKSNRGKFVWSRLHMILAVHPILTISRVPQNHRLVCEYQIVTLSLDSY